MESVNQLGAQFRVEPWMLQVFVVVFLTLLLIFIQKRVLNRLQTRLERTRTGWDDAVLTAVRRPLTPG